MDLRRLEVFAKVAELGSFSRAAETLFLTQPTVSEHVRSLEEELGVQLLDRGGRGATATPAGRLLLGYARRILGLANEARQAVDQFQGRMRGELVLGGSTIPGEYIMPALVGVFRSKYPDITVSLLIGSSRHVSGWVEEGRVEVGIVGARPTGRVLDARVLTADEIVVIVPAGHAWAGRANISIADVRAEPLVVRERGSGSREALETALERAGLTLAAFKVVGEMGSTQAVKQAVRSGVGVAFISKLAAVDECRAGLLSCVTMADLAVVRSFYLVAHAERTRSPLAQAFVEFVESQGIGPAS